MCLFLCMFFIWEKALLNYLLSIAVKVDFSPTGHKRVILAHPFSGKISHFRRGVLKIWHWCHTKELIYKKKHQKNIYGEYFPIERNGLITLQYVTFMTEGVALFPVS